MGSLNAGPEYYAAEERHRNARDYDSKMAALQEMLKFCPKHKSAHTILMDIRGRISSLKKEKVLEAKKKAGKKGAGDFVKAQGAAQVALIGFPNAGKTAVFNALTGLKMHSTPVPFETRETTPGMMEFEKMQVQILDLPSMTESAKPRLYSVARNADLCLVILDPLQGLDVQAEFFADAPNPLPVISKQAISSYAVKYSASALLSKSVSVDTFSPESVLALKRAIVARLDLIRVYTKNPRGEADLTHPFVIRRGGSVLDVAKSIHKDLYANLKYARVWGSSRFSGQQVGGDYKLSDGDILELHMK
ncbi:MAG: GTPase [Candidatus Micrarchaeota archaeon]